MLDSAQTLYLNSNLGYALALYIDFISPKNWESQKFQEMPNLSWSSLSVVLVPLTCFWVVFLVFIGLYYIHWWSLSEQKEHYYPIFLFVFWASWVLFPRSLILSSVFNFRLSHCLGYSLCGHGFCFIGCGGSHETDFYCWQLPKDSKLFNLYKGVEFVHEILPIWCVKLIGKLCLKVDW